MGSISNIFFFCVGVVNGGISTEREIIRSDVETARTLLKQMEEHFNKLEAKVSRFKFHT